MSYSHGIFSELRAKIALRNEMLNEKHESEYWQKKRNLKRANAKFMRSRRYNAYLAIFCISAMVIFIGIYGIIAEKEWSIFWIGMVFLVSNEYIKKSKVLRIFNKIQAKPSP